MPYADVAVDAPVRGGRTFTYSIPPQLTVAPGQMVQVPFGPRMADGIVFQVSETTRIDPVRPIEAADPVGPIVPPSHLELAKWISDYYMASVYASIALMLPPGFRSRTTVYLNKPDDDILDSLEDSIREHLLTHFRTRRQRVAEASIRRGLGREAQRVLDRLLQRGSMTRTWSWRTPRVEPAEERPGNHQVAQAEPHLVPTPHQAQALDHIKRAIEAHEPASFLVQGVTGSGKTEVYLHALTHCIERGRRAIILVPEISLTPQTVQRFEARFPGRVAVLHSRLTTAEHRRMWWGVFHGSYDVVVGSRSALFAPLQPLGLIVIDEEHEWTYKQQDAEPRYHTRPVAMRLAQHTGAVVVLGSATPDVVTYHRALSGQRVRLLSLPNRLGGGSHPDHLPLARVQIADMRRELREGNRSIFSRVLQQALEHTIARGDQAILFINRRGSAGMVQCRDCGHVLRCRSCDTPLTYHTAPEQLLCHQCSRRSRMPSRCPSCRSLRIRYLGLGTQRVVKELDDLLPGVTTLRWDRDAATEDHAHETVVERFGKGEAQVLVGTQMVAKGLHIPTVTLVGAVLADIGLHLPDFRASERVFQLLCQAAGRAGRGMEQGVAIVQTYRPDHYAVAMAAQQDYDAFYRQETEFRRSQRLPPFSRLVHLLYSHTNSDRCQREAERLGRILRHQRQVWGLADADLLGPAPAYPTRIRGRYRWHILLRGADPRLLLDKVEIPEGGQVDVDPVSVM
ncbi:MAG: primosomal protein N' [Dehalococcoidia bacterium]